MRKKGEGEFAAGYEDGTVIIWDVKTHQPFTLQEANKTGIRRLSFTRNGSAIAIVYDDGIINVYDVADGKLLNSGKSDSEVAFADQLFLSPDGNRLAFISFSDIKVWDISQGTIFPLNFQKPVQDLAFNPQGTILAAGNDIGVVNLWDMATRKPLPSKETKSGKPIKRVAFNKDGTLLAACGNDGIVTLFETNKPNIKKVIDLKFDEQATASFDIAFSPDLKKAVYGFTGQNMTLRHINLNTQTEESDVELPPEEFPIVQRSHGQLFGFNNDGDILASADTEDGTIILWDASGRERLSRPLEGKERHYGEIKGSAFSERDNKLVSIGVDGTFISWNINGNENDKPLTNLTASADFVSFDLHGNFAALASNNTVNLWDVPNKALKNSFPKTPDSEAGTNNQQGGTPISSIALCSDASLLAVGYTNGTINLWRTKDADSPTVFKVGGESSVTSLAFSRNNKKLVAGTYDGALMVWDVKSPGSPLPLRGENQNPVSSVAFGLDEDSIIWLHDGGSIFLWDSKTNKPEPVTFAEEQIGTVSNAAYSSDGRVAAFGGTNGAIILWDLEIKEPLGNLLTNHTGDISSLAFSSDGNKLASGNDDGSIIIWDIDLRSWIARACKIANRNLTKAEWGKRSGLTGKITSSSGKTGIARYAVIYLRTQANRILRIRPAAR